MYKLFTSESVSAGHPDKMADLISDSILDAVLSEDESGRVAVETMLTARGIIIAGEVTTTAVIDYETIVRGVVKTIDADYERIAEFINHIVEQSAEISSGVDLGGAGDQGLMFGYSTNETPERLPLPIALANRVIRLLNKSRSRYIYLLADAKAQITVAYDSDDNPVYVDTVVVSTRHRPGVPLGVLRSDILNDVVVPALGSYFVAGKTNVLINPAGEFTIGGPLADAGLTGRKIIVDTYGGYARHGGGAFSGKEPSKVDRSGAYMARYIANNIVDAELADKCEVQIAYAIGVAEPVSVSVDTFGTGSFDDLLLSKAVEETFDMTPRGIIDELDLLNPVYASTASGGHFGRKEFMWENTPMVNVLLSNIESVVSGEYLDIV